MSLLRLLKSAVPKLLLFTKLSQLSNFAVMVLGYQPVLLKEQLLLLLELPYPGLVFMALLVTSDRC